MASLYFKFGTMNSGKSIQLLTIAHNYEESGKNVMIFQALSADREGEGLITSRVGLSRKAIAITSRTSIFKLVFTEHEIYRNIDCVLVDEVQFLDKYQIAQLASIVDEIGIPVIAFGLKNDYGNRLFEGSEYMLRYADNIEEIKTMCEYCNRKAIMVVLFEDGVRKPYGEQFIIDNEDNRKKYRYVSTCRNHYEHAQILPFKRG